MFFLKRMFQSIGNRPTGINEEIQDQSQKRDSFRLNLSYSGVQGFFWGSLSAFMSFLVLYFNLNGYSEIQIGYIMTVISIISIVSPTIMGYIADYYIPIKYVVVFMMLISIPIAFAIGATVGLFPMVLLLTGLLSMSEKSMGSMIDSWGMKLRNRKPYLNYGLTRSVGSLTYAFVAIIIGRFYDYVGISKMFWVHAVFILLFIIPALTLEGVPVTKNRKKEQSFLRTVKKLLQIRQYMILMICMILHGFSVVIVQTFQPILINNHGGTSTHLGLASFVLAICEAPIMFNSNRFLRKYKVEKLLSIAFLFSSLRIIASIIAPSLGWNIAVQSMQAISYGLYLPSILFYITLITPDEMHATAITLAMSLGFGVSGVLGNMLGGVIAQQLGVGAVYYVFTIIAAFSLIVFRVSLKIGAKTENAPV